MGPRGPPGASGPPVSSLLSPTDIDIPVKLQIILFGNR